MTAHVASIVAAALLAAMPAAAEPAEDAALAHLDRGVAAYRSRDFARAHDELLEASRLAPDRPNPYRWLALAEVELDDCQSALINIEAFLSRVPIGDTRIPELVALRDRCLRTGKVTIESTPGGAAIRVDDGPVIAHTPARRLVMPVGEHTVTLSRPGFVSRTARIDVHAFGTDFATFHLGSMTRGRSTPVVRRWWFWAAVATATIAAAGVTYALTSDSPTRLPAVTCDANGCHP
jgi:hypothetical protein